jgi:hypothetical protein
MSRGQQELAHTFEYEVSQWTDWDPPEISHHLDNPSTLEQFCDEFAKEWLQLSTVRKSIEKLCATLKQNGVIHMEPPNPF